MAKYFPKLTQTEVFIKTGPDGSGFNCPMLPISALNEINAITESLGTAKELKEMEATRSRMIALINTVMPETYQGAIARLDIPKLSELIAYLMYGDANDDDQPVKSEKN